MIVRNEIMTQVGIYEPSGFPSGPILLYIAPVILIRIQYTPYRDSCNTNCNMDFNIKIDPGKT